MGYHGNDFAVSSGEAPAERRAEERRSDLPASAVILFRGEPYRVPVLNLSPRGAMIESAIVPRLGETVPIEFDRCSRIQAFVRWSRDGRIGLNFGHEIVLG